MEDQLKGRLLAHELLLNLLLQDRDDLDLLLATFTDEYLGRMGSYHPAFGREANKQALAAIREMISAAIKGRKSTG